MNRVPNWEGSRGNDLVIEICSITISSRPCIAHGIAYSNMLTMASMYQAATGQVLQCTVKSDGTSMFTR